MCGGWYILLRPVNNKIPSGRIFPPSPPPRFRVSNACSAVTQEHPESFPIRPPTPPLPTKQATPTSIITTTLNPQLSTLNNSQTRLAFYNTRLHNSLPSSSLLHHQSASSALEKLSKIPSSTDRLSAESHHLNTTERQYLYINLQTLYINRHDRICSSESPAAQYFKVNSIPLRKHQCQDLC
jgi:hypothetical protein